MNFDTQHKQLPSHFFPHNNKTHTHTHNKSTPLQTRKQADSSNYRRCLVLGPALGGHPVVSEAPHESEAGHQEVVASALSSARCAFSVRRRGGWGGGAWFTPFCTVYVSSSEGPNLQQQTACMCDVRGGCCLKKKKAIPTDETHCGKRYVEGGKKCTSEDLEGGERLITFLTSL